MALENCAYPQDVRVRAEARELVKDGLSVTVLAPRLSGQPRSETLEGVLVKRYRLPALTGAVGIIMEYAVAFMQLGVRLLDELRRGADVVHLHNPPDLLFPIAWLARLIGRKVVFDHHDLSPELYEQKFGSGWPVVALYWCERMTMRCADVVIAANCSHREVAINRGGVAPSRVVVVRNGPAEATIVSQPRIRGGAITDPHLCFVGALGSQDGVSVLPDLLLRLRSGGLRPTLTVVGDGPELALIRRRASELGVSDSITLVGRVAHEDVPSFIDDADICLDVAPRSPLNDSSTMIKISEYLAAGRPTVTFALKETHRTAGDCALYAADGDLEDFCNQITALCVDSALRARLANAGLERARQLTWEKSAEHLSHAYVLATESGAR